MSMINFHFDENGYLQPAQPIELDLSSFEENFVKAFPNSTRRKWLFENYQRYIYRFQDNVFSHFEQWIDGSFISQKENPKDIDMVTFLDGWVYEKRGSKIMDNFYKFSLEDKFLDAYIVREYPKGHANFSNYLFRKNRCFDLFSTDREGVPKGFIKIKFPQ